MFRVKTKVVAGYGQIILLFGMWEGEHRFYLKKSVQAQIGVG